MFSITHNKFAPTEKKKVKVANFSHVKNLMRLLRVLVSTGLPFNRLDVVTLVHCMKQSLKFRGESIEMSKNNEEKGMSGPQKDESDQKCSVFRVKASRPPSLPLNDNGEWQ